MIDKQLQAAARKFQQVTGRAVEYCRVSDGSKIKIVATPSAGKVTRETVNGVSITCRRREYIVLAALLPFTPERNDTVIDVDGVFELYAPDNQNCFRKMSDGRFVRLYAQGQ